MILLGQFVRERLANGAAVLDVGCGHGNFVIDELQGSWGRKVGIDLSVEETAGNVSLDEIVCGRLESLPFADHSFDIVLSLWVLEHLENPQKGLKEIYRVLKPGGFFAFVTPNASSFLILIRRLSSKRFANWINESVYGRKEKDTFEVYYRFNKMSDIQKFATSIGFQTEILWENQEPSYTSFGPITYRLSVFLSRLPSALFRPHLIGILRKK